MKSLLMDREFAVRLAVTLCCNVNFPILLESDETGINSIVANRLIDSLVPAIADCVDPLEDDKILAAVNDCVNAIFSENKQITTQIPKSIDDDKQREIDMLKQQMEEMRRKLEELSAK